MFLRFIGVSLISAAGPAAQVPSRIGGEQEAVLGSTHPNGTAVSGSSDASAAAGGQKDVLTDGSSSTAGGKATLGGDGALEGLVHASSALVLVGLMVAAFFGFLWFRRRTQRLARSGDGWGSLGGAAVSKLAGVTSRHERGRSRGGQDGFAPVSTVGEDSDEREGGGVGGGRHELDDLMASRGGKRRDGEYHDDDEGVSGVAGRRRDEEEEIFGLGGEDDEEDEEENGGGETRRRG